MSSQIQTKIQQTTVVAIAGMPQRAAAAQQVTHAADADADAYPDGDLDALPSSELRKLENKHLFASAPTRQEWECQFGMSSSSSETSRPRSRSRSRGNMQYRQPPFTEGWPGFAQINIGGGMNWMFIPEGSTIWCGYGNVMYYAEAIAGQEYAQWRRCAEHAGADGVAGPEPDHTDTTGA